MKMKKILAIAAAAAMLCGLTGCNSDNSGNSGNAGSSGDKTYNIGICQLIEHPALDAATQGFQEIGRAHV